MAVEDRPVDEEKLLLAPGLARALAEVAGLAAANCAETSRLGTSAYQRRSCSA